MATWIFSITLKYLSWSTLIMVYIQVLAVDGLPKFPRNIEKCRMCRPGYYADIPCNDVTDTVCKKCPEKHFTSKLNVQVKCDPCSNCAPGLFQSNNCTRTSDVICKSCKFGSIKVNLRYTELCSESIHDDILVNDDPDAENIKTFKPFQENDEINDNKEENDFSGDVALSDLGQSEGQGLNVTEISERRNETNVAVDWAEGSGHATDDIIDFNETILTVKVTDDVTDDELIPVSKVNSVVPKVTSVVTTATSVVTKATVDLDVLDQGSGFIVDGSDHSNISSLDGSPIVDGPGHVIDIDASGDGDYIWVLEPNVDTNNILGLIPGEGEPELPIAEENDSDDKVESILRPPEMKKEHIDADNKKEPVVMSGMNGKTRTGIIIGVAAGAVIFFSLGFFASRQCKKQQTLKALKKLDEKTKTKPNNNRTEYRSGRTTGKYDPGANERNSTTGANTSDVVLISTKPLKTAGVAEKRKSASDKHVNGIDKIKYMDETEEDVSRATVRDKLLPESDNSNSEDKNMNSLTSVMKKFDDKLTPVEEDVEEERQPMIVKASTDHNDGHTPGDNSENTTGDNSGKITGDNSGNMKGDNSGNTTSDNPGNTTENQSENTTGDDNSGNTSGDKAEN